MKNKLKCNQAIQKMGLDIPLSYSQVVKKSNCDCVKVYALIGIHKFHSFHLNSLSFSSWHYSVFKFTHQELWQVTAYLWRWEMSTLWNLCNKIRIPVQLPSAAFLQDPWIPSTIPVWVGSEIQAQCNKQSITWRRADALWSLGKCKQLRIKQFGIIQAILTSQKGSKRDPSLRSCVLPAYPSALLSPPSSDTQPTQKDLLNTRRSKSVLSADSTEIEWGWLKPFCTFRAWHGDLEDGRCSWTQLSFISFPPKCLSSFLLTLKPLLHIWSCFWQTVFFSSTINENLLRLRQWEFLSSLSSERLVQAWQVLNIWRYLMPDEIAQLKYVEFTIPFLRRENWRAPILKANRPKVASQRGYMGVDVCWESSLWGQTNKDLGGGLENKI